MYQYFKLLERLLNWFIFWKQCRCQMYTLVSLKKILTAILCILPLILLNVALNANTTGHHHNQMHIWDWVESKLCRLYSCIVYLYCISIPFIERGIPFIDIGLNIFLPISSQNLDFHQDHCLNFLLILTAILCILPLILLNVALNANTTGHHVIHVRYTWHIVESGVEHQ
jgi:hypothetical protein